MTRRGHYEDEDLSCFAGFKHMLFGTSPRRKRFVAVQSSKNLGPITVETTRITSSDCLKGSASATGRPDSIRPRRRSQRSQSLIQADTIIEVEPSSFDTPCSSSTSSQPGPVPIDTPGSSSPLKAPKREPGRKYSTTLDKWVTRSEPAASRSPPDDSLQTQTQAQTQQHRPTPYLAFKNPPPSRTELSSGPVAGPASGSTSTDVAKPKSRRTSTWVTTIDTATAQKGGEKVDAMRFDSPMGVMVPVSSPGGAGGYGDDYDSGCGGGIVFESAFVLPAVGGAGKASTRRTSDWFG